MLDIGYFGIFIWWSSMISPSKTKVIYHDHATRCFRNGQYHRDGGPAIMYDNGDQVWCYDGLIHRIGGPAVINTESLEWYLFGRLHREDGPAVIKLDGTEYWYQHGLFHREDGPAAILANNEVRWYINNKHITDRTYYQQLTGLSDEAMTILILKYGDIK